MALKILGRRSSSNVQKVLWCCAELGIEYEQTDVGAEHGGNDEAWYLALNPNGRVPTIDDGGFVLWESNAIVRYLSAKHGVGTLWPADLPARADADRWMDWQQTCMAVDMRALARTLLKTPPDATPADTLEAAKKGATAAWRILDAQLAGKDYLTGPRLTMADIVFGNAVCRWFELPIERPELPNVAAWYAKLKVRPGFRQHITSQ